MSCSNQTSATWPGFERTLEQHLAASLGFEAAIFIRTGAEVLAVADFQPFPAADLAQAVAFNVAFLHEPIDETATQKLMALKTEIDDFYINGREIYWLCRQKQSESTFSNAVLEKTIGRPATLRGMNTIRKMSVKYDFVR